jgi:hypothetical protein
MTGLIVSAIVLVGLPVLLVFFLKTNAGVMFFAGCAGLVLLGTLDPALVTTAGSVVPVEGEAYVRLAVVLLSIVFAAIIFSHSVQGSKILIHMLIAVLMGIMLWLVLPSSTGISWLLGNARESIWRDFNEFRTLIVAAGFTLSLLSLSQKRSSKHEKHK